MTRPQIAASDAVALNAMLMAVRQGADVVCDRWSLSLIIAAFLGDTKFAEFERRTGIASRLATMRLRTLVEQGIMVRLPYSIRPLRHEYRLTIMGETQPADCSAHCAAVAAPPKTPHNARYAATKKKVRAPSPRRRFSAEKHTIIGAAEGSIIAAIITAHMTNTASQFAADQWYIGMVSRAVGLFMLVAPHNRMSQPPSVKAQMLNAVQRRPNIKSRDDAAKPPSVSVGEWREEGISPSDIAFDPEIIDFEV